jgi:hypothetical protein
MKTFQADKLLAKNNSRKNKKHISGHLIHCSSMMKIFSGGELIFLVMKIFSGGKLIFR